MLALAIACEKLSELDHAILWLNRARRRENFAAPG